MLFFAVVAGGSIFVVLMVGFGYQMTFGRGYRLRREDRRWWRFDFIWPPMSDSGKSPE